MGTRIVAQEQPISRIFSNDYVFRIPSYQRPYSWTTEQAGELLEDLVAFMKSGPASVENMPPYFLGSIVLIKSENAPEADVVDGQQRLTTITLLLSAIRASIPDKAASVTKLIYEEGDTILGTKDRFRLSLRDRDQEFFQKFVQLPGKFRDLLTLPPPNTDSQKNIWRNARLLFERLKQCNADEQIRLAQFVATRCFLVAVATPDLDSAYRIFSVLNSRGLDLSATDILKSEIIGGVPQELREGYTKKWEDAEDDLGREAFGELFSHVRMVFRKSKPQGTLLKEFREHVTAKFEPVKFIDEVLIPYADVYEQISDNAYSSNFGADKVNESLRWLNRLEFNDWLPPALAFSVKNQHNPQAIVSFFADLERLSYFMLLVRAGISERIERFSRVTSAIEAGVALSDEDSPIQLRPTEQGRMYDVLSGPLYETLSARARTTVLLRLDSLLSGGGAHYDYPVITVEHVLPQTPKIGSQWLEWFPEPSQRIGWIHKLGNLTLLTRKKNSSASNYDFARKKKSYFSNNGVSPFAITTQVLEHSSWLPETLEVRQKELLSKLEKHWRLEGRKSELEELLELA